jgi:hypothetical protein
MATLDLRDSVKPTDGRQESAHAVDVGTTYTLIYWPPRRLFRSASVRGNDGALIWATGATEGGTPNANDPHVPSGVDDQLVAWRRRQCKPAFYTSLIGADVRQCHLDKLPSNIS